jgi:hypothetical protein
MNSPIKDLAMKVIEAGKSASRRPWLNHVGEFVSQDETYMTICRVNVPIVMDLARGIYVNGRYGSEQPNKEYIVLAANHADQLARACLVMEESLKEAIRFISNGDNGPPQFYIDTVDRIVAAVAQANKICAGDSNE